MVMLAKELKWEKVKYPCIIQPKIDGIRAYFKDGKLYTRTDKLITSMPHLHSDLPLDGELYCEPFERLCSLVKRKEPHTDHKEVKFLCFDTINDELCKDRILDSTIPHEYAHDETTLDMAYQAYLKAGYEGIIIRDPLAKYEHKRTYSLMKLKPKKDAEYQIVNFFEGKGKLEGKLGAFVCRAKNTNFRVKMKGTFEKLEEYWIDRESYRGKMLTVQYQNLTKYGIPRFPIGLRIRE